MTYTEHNRALRSPSPAIPANERENHKMRIVLVRPNWITRRMILPPLGMGLIK